MFPTAQAASFQSVAEPFVPSNDQRAFLRLDPGILAGDDAEAVNDEDVGAEVGDSVGDVHIEAGDDAHNGNEGSNGEYDAQ